MSHIHMVEIDLDIGAKSGTSGIGPNQEEDGESKNSMQMGSHNAPWGVSLAQSLK